MRRLEPALALLGVVALAAAGCGGGKKKTTPTPAATSGTQTAPTGGGTKLHIAADKSQLKFDTSSLSAKAGKVTITMTNPSALTHDVSIKGNGVNAIGNTVGTGGTSTASATLKPGTYEFYCSVDGHADAGMKGKLVVK